MSTTRKALGAVAVTVALLTGAACTGPPPTQEQVGEALGDGIGWILTILVANIVCSLNPDCPSPVCALFPCSPAPQGLEAPDPQLEPVGG